MYIGVRQAVTLVTLLSVMFEKRSEEKNIFKVFIAPRSAHHNVQKVLYRSKAVAWCGVLVKLSNPHFKYNIRIPAVSQVRGWLL